MNELDTSLITDNIISAIEEGLAEGNWTKPWRILGGERPLNALTNSLYKGMNILILKFKEDRHGYTTPYWAGIRQWNRLGAKVLPKEKHTKIIFHEMRTYESDVNGETENRTYPFMKTLRVWNADQVKGWEPPKLEEITISDDIYIEICERFMEAVPIKVVWKGNVACFIPSINEVHMPPREQFLQTKDGNAAYNVYSTAFHEFGHATGHESRLNRKFGKKHGDKAYAIEELVAEITSAFLCGQFGIADKTTPRPDHLKYIEHWFKIVKENPQILLKAAADAGKAVEYLNATTEKTLGQKAA